MASSHIVFIGKIKPYLRKIVLSQQSAGQVYWKALGEKGILLNKIMVFHKWKQKNQTQTDTWLHCKLYFFRITKIALIVFPGASQWTFFFLRWARFSDECCMLKYHCAKWVCSHPSAYLRTCLQTESSVICPGWNECPLDCLIGTSERLNVNWSASKLSRKFCLVGVLQDGSRSSWLLFTSSSVMLCGRERLLPPIAAPLPLTIISVFIPCSVHFEVGLELEKLIVLFVL